MPIVPFLYASSLVRAQKENEKGRNQEANTLNDVGWNKEKITKCMENRSFHSDALILVSVVVALMTVAMMILLILMLVVMFMVMTVLTILWVFVLIL